MINHQSISDSYIVRENYEAAKAAREEREKIRGVARELFMHICCEDRSIDASCTLEKTTDPKIKELVETLIQLNVGIPRNARSWLIKDQLKGEMLALFNLCTKQ